MTALSEVEFSTMITLTYPRVFPLNGKTCKAHLNRFLVWLRRHYKGVSYLWFLEFQARGAPHYHILTSVPQEDISRGVMARSWAQAILKTGAADWRGTMAEYEKIVAVHSHKSAWERIKASDNGVRYLLKYAQKQRQKEVPPGFVSVGRFWGASRDVKNDDPPRIDYDIDDGTLRDVLRKGGVSAALLDVLPRYIFLPDGEIGGSE